MARVTFFIAHTPEMRNVALNEFYVFLMLIKLIHSIKCK